MADDTDAAYAVEVVQTLYKFAEKELFTDFKIHAGNKTAHCHGAVVSAKSDYFASVCSAGTTEAVLEAAIEEDEDLLASLIKFMYLGKTDITVENVESLLLAAHSIKHEQLKVQCEEVMVPNLTIQSLKSYHGLAKRAGLPKLNRACERLSREEFGQVSHSDWFLSLSVDEVEEYLRDDDINVASEDEVIDALQRWFRNSEASHAEKEGFVEILFPCIRLSFCSTSKLYALSKEAAAMDKLRLKIFEFLNHSLHGDHTARTSYASNPDTTTPENLQTSATLLDEGDMSVASEPDTDIIRRSSIPETGSRTGFVPINRGIQRQAESIDDYSNPPTPVNGNFARSSTPLSGNSSRPPTPGTANYSRPLTPVNGIESAPVTVNYVRSSSPAPAAASNIVRASAPVPGSHAVTAAPVIRKNLTVSMPTTGKLTKSTSPVYPSAAAGPLKVKSPTTPVSPGPMKGNVPMAGNAVATPAAQSLPTASTPVMRARRLSAPLLGKKSSSLPGRGKLARSNSTITEDDHVFLLGGRIADLKLHKEILSFNHDRPPHLQDPVYTNAPAYNFSVCGMGDSLVVSGGCDLSLNSIKHVKQFNMDTLAWSDLPDMSKPVDCHGSAILDGRLFTLAGAYTKGGHTEERYKEVNALDLIDRYWASCQPLPIAVETPGVVVADNQIMAIGGHTGETWSDRVFKYNSQMDEWRECQRMPKMRKNISNSTVANKKQVFVLGGDLFLQYDIGTDCWVQLTPPLQPSRQCATVLRQGRVIAMGGWDKHIKRPNDRIQTYDLFKKTWRVEKSVMPLALCQHAAVVLKSNHPKTYTFTAV